MSRRSRCPVHQRGNLRSHQRVRTSSGLRFQQRACDCLERGEHPHDYVIPGRSRARPSADQPREQLNCYVPIFLKGRASKRCRQAPHLDRTYRVVLDRRYRAGFGCRDACSPERGQRGLSHENRHDAEVDTVDSRTAPKGQIDSERIGVWQRMRVRPAQRAHGQRKVKRIGEVNPTRYQPAVASSNDQQLCTCSCDALEEQRRLAKMDDSTHPPTPRFRICMHPDVSGNAGGNLTGCRGHALHRTLSVTA